MLHLLGQVRLAIRIGLGLFVVLLVAPIQAGAQQRTVVEEILDILKSRGQISDGEYRALNERARQEEAARQQAAEQLEAAEKRAAEAERRAAEAEQRAAGKRAVKRPPAAQPPAEQRAAERPPAEQQPAAEKVPVAVAKTREEDDPSTFRAYWKEGLRFDTAGGDFKLRIGGRIQLDGAILAPSGNLQSELDLDSFESGVEFRRARIYLEGTIYEDFGYKFEYDFADQSFKDVYIEAYHVPFVQEIRAGHFKEPFSLEELTSSRFLTFMERALPNVFAPTRKTGIEVHQGFFDDRMTYALGAFRGDTNDLGFGFGGEQAYDITTRVTGLPWYEGEGHLLHLGLGYSHQFRSNFVLDYRQRPEAHLVPRFVNTGDFVTDGVDLLNPEVALVVGPFSAQAEYIQTFVQAPDEPGNPRFFGWYGYLSYFLTGEHRMYKLSKAAFDRVYPHENFGFSKGSGWGAWEAAIRFSQLNLDSAGVNGGRLNDTTLALNWYLNPNLRLMANYIYSERTPPSSASVYQARIQVDY